MPLTGTQTVRTHRAATAAEDGDVFYVRPPHGDIRFAVNTSGTVTTLGFSIEGRVDENEAWTEITTIAQGDLDGSGNYVSGLIKTWPQMRTRVTSLSGAGATVEGWVWYGA